MRFFKKIFGALAGIVIVLAACLSIFSAGAQAQAIVEEVGSSDTRPPVRTDTPHDTLRSLQTLHDALIEAVSIYQTEKTIKNYDRVDLIAEALISLLDLSDENAAARRDTSIRTGLALIDIVEQVDLEILFAPPDSEAIIAELEGVYAVPGTPLMLQRIDTGPREGEYLFSANSSKIAPRYLREIAIETPERLDDLWSTRFLQISGPWIPAAFDASLPDWAKDLYWGTPLWKIVVSLLSLGLIVAFLIVVRNAIKRRVKKGRLTVSSGMLIRSSTTLVALILLNRFCEYQLFLTGSVARTETFVSTSAIYAALAWTFWHFMGFVSDYIAARRAQPERPADDSMMRLLNHIVALIGVIWILAYGAQSLGFPLLSILAGLGVGGLAVALAIRPTLENLISGFVLYIEKSVRVGDYCSFSGQSGTVEQIGVRSTHVRALDRTLIAIPNSKFVDMELINWAQCDEMLIHAVIGLRYETNTDQLRYVLAEIRQMMYGHPRIKTETARVRLVGYGASSLDVDIRVYAQTREWNDFYAIREDVLFRIKEIVEASGTGFAFPSQTVYMSKDTGLDEEKSKAAVSEVERWRRMRQLPFPNFSSDARERIENALRYPPQGSHEYFGPEEDTIHPDEPLSAEDGSRNDDNEAETKMEGDKRTAGSKSDVGSVPPDTRS